MRLNMRLHLAGGLRCFYDVVFNRVVDVVPRSVDIFHDSVDAACCAVIPWRSALRTSEIRVTLVKHRHASSVGLVYDVMHALPEEAVALFECL